MNRAERKSGAGWYIAAITLAISGCVTSVAMAWQAITLMTDSTQFLAPGRIVIGWP